LFIVLGGGMALRARQRPVLVGQEELIGSRGEVLSAGERGETWALVRGERWQVKSATRLEPGTAVRVTGVHGLTLEVAADPTTTSPKEAPP
jgi:membrane-bound serine protease (ClpP class)